MGGSCAPDQHHTQANTESAVFQTGHTLIKIVCIFRETVGDITTGVLYDQVQHILFSHQPGVNSSTGGCEL